MTAALVWQAESDSPELTNVSFVLARNRLVSICYSEPMAFRVFKAYAERERTVLSSGAATLVTLLECIVDRDAEILEQTALQVDSISREVFAEETGPRARRAGKNLALALRQIAKRQNFMAKTRESLVSLGRLASFLMLAPEIGEGADRTNDKQERAPSAPQITSIKQNGGRYLFPIVRRTEYR